MKKKILGLALVSMSLVAFTGMAQNNSGDNNSKAGQENVKMKKGDKKNGRAQVNPFEGLTLTETQQAQLKQLNDKRKVVREQQMQARKENKQRNDSARMADRRAAKKEYLEEVKAIIGPDQYVVFLENMYVNGGAQNKGDKAAFNGNNGKDKAQGDRQGRDNRKNDHRGHHAFNHSSNNVSASAK